MNKRIAVIFAAFVMGLAALTGCSSHRSNNGYEQVWDNGHYVYVPYDYYHSHLSLYNNSLHPAHHYSSSYVSKHHITVSHTTTTTTRNGRTTTTNRTTTTHHSTTNRTTTRRSTFGRRR